MIKSQPATIGKGGSRIWCYPVEITGKRNTQRTWIAFFLLVLFYAVPFLKWGGSPFLRLHFSRGHFFMMGQPIVLAEMYHFVLLAILLVLILFLASALWGRVWCGYACPQTIFIEHILRRIEFWIEGPALKRRANDQKALTLKRASQKSLKYFLFLLISFSFSATLVSYFTEPSAAWALQDPLVATMVGLLTVLAMFNGTYWREQFCTIACPYARLQSVFQDSLTKSFGYDLIRGEPRSKQKLTTTSKTGDCIDCGLCVRVCPTSIDIRQGMNQLECLNCGRCADACDTIMKNLNRPPGLVRFDSEDNFSGKLKQAEDTSVQKGSDALIQGSPTKFWRIRKRVAFYLMAIAFVGGVGIWEFARRAPVRIEILNAGSAPYFRIGKRISNLLQIKISNQTTAAQNFSISIGNAALQIDTPVQLKNIEPGQTKSIPLLISYDEGSYQGDSTKVTIEVVPLGEKFYIERSFVVPGKSKTEN